MKTLVAILAGLIAGLLIFFVGMLIFRSLYPYPLDIDMSSRVSYEAFLSSLPTKAYITLIVIHSLSIFASGLVASIINSRTRLQAGVIAALPFLTYFIVQNFSYDYPTYYVVSDITSMILVGFAAVTYGGTRVVS